MHSVCAGTVAAQVDLEHLLVINPQKPEDILWSFEQTLRCKSFGAVVAWPVSVKDREVRRLQLAAEAGRSIGFMYRSPTAAHEASPAAVRLHLEADAGGLRIDIIKCRGIRGGICVHGSRNAALPSPGIADAVFVTAGCAPVAGRSQPVGLT